MTDNGENAKLRVRLDWKLKAKSAVGMVKEEALHQALRLLLEFFVSKGEQDLITQVDVYFAEGGSNAGFCR